MKTFSIFLFVLFGVSALQAHALDFANPLVDCRSSDGKIMVQVGRLNNQYYLRAYEWILIQHPGYGTTRYPNPLTKLQPVNLDGIDNGSDGIAVYYGGVASGDSWDAPWDSSPYALEVILQGEQKSMLDGFYRQDDLTGAHTAFQLKCSLK